MMDDMAQNLNMQISVPILKFFPAGINSPRILSSSNMRHFLSLLMKQKLSALPTRFSPNLRARDDGLDRALIDNNSSLGVFGFVDATGNGPLDVVELQWTFEEHCETELKIFLWEASSYWLIRSPKQAKDLDLPSTQCNHCRQTNRQPPLETMETLVEMSTNSIPMATMELLGPAMARERCGESNSWRRYCR